MSLAVLFLIGSFFVGLDSLVTVPLLPRIADSTGTEMPAATTTPKADGTASGTPGSPSRDCETVETNGCYGSAHVTVQSDGAVRVIYSIC